ncbi:hypothetical protein C8J56DRAFT_717274, partial [Mycena floridula]
SLLLTQQDWDRLSPGKFLNDSLVEGGLNIILQDPGCAAIAENFHIFTSFFYTSMAKAPSPDQAYEKVKKWTKGFDIFQKRVILVPINLK